MMPKTTATYLSSKEHFESTGVTHSAGRENTINCSRFGK